LALAIRVAETIARRRNEVATTSRDAAHDAAGAFNVIGLIVEAARHGRLDHAAAVERIQDLLPRAGENAWRVGRGHRSSSTVVGSVNLCTFFQEAVFPGDIDVTIATDCAFVLADRDKLRGACAELMGNARQAGATRVGVAVSASRDGGTIQIVVSDDGAGFPSDRVAVGRPFTAAAGSDRLGLGLAVVAEHLQELGGDLEVLDSGADGALTRVALTLPRLDPVSLDPALRPMLAGDPASAQADILESVVRHAPLEESLEGIVAAIESQLPGAVCSVLLSHDGCRLRHGAGARLPLAYRDAIDGVEIGVGQGSCGTAAHTRRPVIARDVTTDHNWVDFRSIALEHGLRSCWSTPIVAAEGGETLGTFAVYTSGVWSPDEAATGLVNRYTYLAAVAIEHHRLFGALAESEARFRSAFEGAAAGIALATLDGVVLKSNPALDDIVQCRVGRLAGSSLLDLIATPYRSLVADSWAQLTNGDLAATADPVEVPLAATVDASETWLSLHTSLIPGESGQRPYLYVEVRDVTAARQQLADLRAREAAEAANRAKTHFLALASHELRTPLNAILGFAQVMQLVDLDECQRGDSVGHIMNAGNHLRDLIDQLLDLSRIEAGQLSVDIGPVDVGKVVDEALELVGPLAAARDIELVGHGDASAAHHVLGDHRCLRQVLINLLDNAVKYTSSGGRVEMRVEGLDRSVIRVTVTDSGQGISADSLEAIFEPFHRLDRAADGESAGSGLGLALCARLMQEMDGSIGVTSELERGSSFWIELPPTAAAGTTVVSPRFGPDRGANRVANRGANRGANRVG